VTNEQDSLFLGHGDERLPGVYIACSLTGIQDDREAQHTLSGFCRVIQDAIDAETLGVEGKEDTDRWAIRTNVPFKTSSPWAAGEASGREIYERNVKLLRTDTDALIIIGHRGGSMGCGQELEWAAAQSLPTLYLRPEGQPLSRQVEGAAEHMDLSIIEFADADALGRVVRRWVTRRRHAIEDTARRRNITRGRLTTAQAMMRWAWSRLDVDGRIKITALTRLKPMRINDLMLDPDALATSSVSQLLALSAALGLDLGRLFSPLPVTGQALGKRELGALRQAAEENGWNAPTVIDLILTAERAVAAGGTRRMPFTNIGDWTRLWEFRRSRE
jgi:hypothetical protein